LGVFQPALLRILGSLGRPPGHRLDSIRAQHDITDTLSWPQRFSECRETRHCNRQGRQDLAGGCADRLTDGIRSRTRV